MVTCYLHIPSIMFKIKKSAVIDIKRLLQGILFNLIIGNNDAHGKNFSLLYQGQQTHLAPFYDMISTVHYANLSTKLAMKIGSQYDFDNMFPRHIEQMAVEANLSVSLVRNETINLLNQIQNNISSSPFSSTILQRIDKLSQRFQKIQ